MAKAAGSGFFLFCEAVSDCGENLTHLVDMLAATSDGWPMREPVTKKPVEILVPWRAELIPRGCRNLRTIYVGETMHAEIRTPAADEARVAFRLSRARWRREGILPNGAMDVVFCDGALWWPVSPWTDDVRSRFYRSRLGRNPDHYIDADRLLGCLAGGAHDLLALASFQNVDRYEDLVPFDELPLVRVWREDNKTEMMALAQRRASENLMVWEGKAFVRGGEPVYAQYPLGDGHSDDGMANTGADRAVDPYAAGLTFDIGRFEYGQRAIMHGKFQRADERALAEANRSVISRTISKFQDNIEVLMPEAVRLERPVVRLDAIYRAADRALKASEDPAWIDMRALFAEVSTRDPKGAATSFDRCDALVRFSRLASDRTELSEELQEAYECFVSFETSEDASALGPSPLTPEDDAALGDLGGASP